MNETVIVLAAPAVKKLRIELKNKEDKVRVMNILSTFRGKQFDKILVVLNTWGLFFLHFCTTDYP